MRGMGLPTRALAAVLVVMSVTITGCRAGGKQDVSAHLSSGDQSGLIDVPRELASSTVHLGYSGSDALPAVRVGKADVQGAVWLYTESTSAFKKLPALPVQGFIASSSSVATPSFVVLNLEVCSRAPTLSKDVGPSCEEGDASFVIAVFDRSQESWRVTPSPSAVLSTLGVAGSGTVVIQGRLPDQTTASWALDLSALKFVTAASPPTSVCMIHTDPALEFDAVATEVTTARLRSEDGLTVTEVALPEPVRGVGIGTIRACYSAGPWLGLPGDPPPVGSASDPSAERADRGPTQTFVGPSRGTSSLTVFNVKQKDSPPVDLGEATSVNSFVGNERYVAIADNRGVHVIYSGKATAITPLSGEHGRLVGLSLGPAIADFGEKGELVSFMQVRH